MFYFAYGGNTNRTHISKHYPNVKFFSRGKLNNYKVVFRKVSPDLKMENSYCDIDTCVDSVVDGVIYTLEKEDVLKLDKQEKEGVLYNRVLVDIQDEFNNTINCYTYIMINKENPYGLPTLRYYKIVLDGYTEYGLNINKLVDAIKLVK